MSDTASPGSDEARAQGCKCPVLDNGHGRGWMGNPYMFVMSECCPLHRSWIPHGGRPPRAGEQDEGSER